MAAPETNDDLAGLKSLLATIFREQGLDFREYRESTLARRLRRRVRARCVDTYAEYVRVLEEDPGEFEKLLDGLTMNGTSFFRDEAAFDALKETVVPALIETGAEKGRRLRIWSAACATGEEPYSIGMLLLERLDAEADRWDIKIAGTDTDHEALRHAEEGLFAPDQVEGIRDAWLGKYFDPEERGLRVQPDLRRLMFFRIHNLVSDPYYRDLDLVVCRNVLISFTPALQTKVLNGLHEGLRQGGFLLLGKAEAPARDACGLFDCVDPGATLYQKPSAAPRGVAERRGPQEERPAPAVAEQRASACARARERPSRKGERP